MSTYLRAVIFWTAVVSLVAFVMVSRGHAHDEDHDHDAWYSTLMMPDNPTSSCCGTADAYWCDDYYARDGKAYCKITDDRDDEPLKRPHVPIGSEIEIPDYKLKWDRGNPTGHAVVFLSSTGHVYCFVQSSGI